MKWLLVFWIMGGANEHNRTPLTIEFSTQQLCETALAKLAPMDYSQWSPRTRAIADGAHAVCILQREETK